jgi:Uma2 family endonuclease
MELETKQAELPLMTEEEFEAWCDEDTRAEFVDGKVIIMSPANLFHVRLARFLIQLLGVYLELRPHGELLPTEYQVRLRAGLRRLPDLLYVSAERRDRLTRTYLDGAPDAAWEIISPDSQERDWRDKYDEYEASGVREYWIIDPHSETAWLHRLDESGKYQSVPPQEGRLVSEVIPEFWLRAEWLWREPKPKVLDCLREIGALA